MPIILQGQNLWTLTIVYRSTGELTIMPCGMPLELHAKLLEFLRRELHAPTDRRQQFESTNA